MGTIELSSYQEFACKWEPRISRELKSIGGIGNASWHDLRRVMLEAANQFRNALGESLLPVRLDAYKHLRRINAETWFESGKKGIDAILAPNEQGFTLRLRKNQSRARLRFSIAHEIGHTFFYDIGKSPPIRLVSQSSDPKVHQCEEEICSAFARELLIPRPSIVDAVNSLRTHNRIGVLIHLALRYDVSPEVIARRLLHDLTIFPTSIVLFRGVYADNGPSGQQQGTYRGLSTKSLRKQEQQAYSQIKSIVQKSASQHALGEVRDLYSDIISLQWRQDTRDYGSRLIVWIDFLRLHNCVEQKKSQSQSSR